jgi:hypothetical protein
VLTPLTSFLVIETGNIATSLEVKKTEEFYTEIKVKERYLDAECQRPYTCDFEEWAPNVRGPYDPTESCGFYISSSKPINIFNSSDIKSQSWRDDPDLGSPNVKCDPSGPGRGRGGIPSSNYPNCDPLGNVLIIQNPWVKNRPNDDAKGGCIFFDLSRVFPDHQNNLYDWHLFNFGLLDIEEGAKITVRNSLSRH